MKCSKISSLIFFLLFINASFANTCVDKTSYYSYFYLNGVNVNIKESYISIKMLIDVFKVDEINQLYNPTDYKGEYAYSSGWFNQLRHFKGLVGNLYQDIFNEVLPQKFYETTMLKSEDPNKFLSNINKNPTKELIEQFLPLLNNQKMNVIIAHSQGNLVANQLCHYKNKREIEIVSIASPAGETPCNTLKNYELFSNDEVINALKYRMKVSMVSEKFLKETEEDKLPVADTLHHVLDRYLKTPQVLSRLEDNLIKTNELNYKKNMNFSFIKNDSLKDISNEDICVVDTAGDYGNSIRIMTGRAPISKGSSCFKLKDKSSLTKDEERAVKYLKLGKNMSEIANSISMIKNLHPELVSSFNIKNTNFPGINCLDVKEGTFSFMNENSSQSIIISKDEEGIFHQKENLKASRSISSENFSAAFCNSIYALEGSSCEKELSLLNTYYNGIN